MLIELSFVELPVADYEQAKTFYTEVFGLRIAHDDEKNQWCLFDISDGMTGIAIYGSEQPMPMEAGQRAGDIRLVLRVDDFEGILARLRHHGLVMESVRIHADESFRISGTRDLFGYLWRFWSPL